MEGAMHITNPISSPIESIPGDILDHAETGSYNNNNFALSPSFEDRVTSCKFKRNVFFLLAFELSFMVAFIALFLFDPFQSFGQSNAWIALIALLMAIEFALILANYERTRRIFPLNLIIIATICASLGIVFAIATLIFATKIFITSVAMAWAMVICLCVFAIQSKIDYLHWAGILIQLWLNLLLASIAIATLGLNGWIQTLVGFIFSLLFTSYLIYLVEKMVKGKHRRSVDPTEFSYGATLLFMDILGQQPLIGSDDDPWFRRNIHEDD